MTENISSANEMDRPRDRSRRIDRGSRFSDVDSNNQRDRSNNRDASKRIYVSNLPYQYRCQDLKELFQRVVGTVVLVEMFVDESDNPNGCAIVEFQNSGSVQEALQKMNSYELTGREIVVTVDHAEERDKYGRIVGVSRVGAVSGESGGVSRVDGGVSEVGGDVSRVGEGVSGVGGGVSEASGGVSRNGGSVRVVIDGISNGAALPLPRHLHTNILESIANRTNTLRVRPKHWNKVPTLEDVKTKYGFKLRVHPRWNPSCSFNENDGKMYISTAVLTVDVFYKPPLVNSPYLFLRAMVVFSNTDEMHLPVKRCVNHRATNRDVPREHMLKCFHPKTLYMGNENFKSFGKRLSTLIPLGYPRITRSGIATNRIFLKFLCETACVTGINNRNTVVVFTLENDMCEIYGKKVIPFKVSTQPKRDMELDMEVR